MLLKRAQYTAEVNDVQMIYAPTGSNLGVFTDQHLEIDQSVFEQIKIASQKTSDVDKTSHFDLEAEIREHTDSLFVKCFAIKADETNDNGDYFSKAELKKAVATFVGVPVFTNHQNTDVNQARGKVIHSWWDDSKNGIMVIMRVDAVAYPQLARGMKEKYVVGTSMGCFLGHNRVLMGDGTYCPIQDVQAGDLVVTHKGNIKPVVNLQRHVDKEKAEILHLSITGIKDTIDVTKDHPFYVPKIQDICACGCGENMYVPQHSEWVSKYQKRYIEGHYQKTTIKIADIRNSFEFEWKSANDLKVGDVLCMPRLIGDKALLTKDQAQLIGLFLAEGSYLKYKGTRMSVEFNLNLEEEQHTLAPLICKLLVKVFKSKNTPKTYKRPKRNTVCVRLNDKNVAQWFYHRCGEYSYGKKMHPDIMSENSDTLQTILGTYMSGDGQIHTIDETESYRLCTTSKDLRDQFDTILNKIGIVHSTYVVVGDKCSYLRIAAGLGPIPVSYAGVDARRPAYYIQMGNGMSKRLSKSVPFKEIENKDASKYNNFILDKYILTKIHGINRSFNADPVYTLEVKDDHSYVVEGVAVKNCRVEGSCCSICHAYAQTPDQYCAHIKDRKTRKISEKNIKCKYHERGTETECPHCGSTKDNIKKFSVEDQKVFEYNYGIHFIENSAVVSPACPSCGITEIIDTEKFLSKVADLDRRLPFLLKAAKNHQVMCTDVGCISAVTDEQENTLLQSLDYLKQGSDYVVKNAGLEIFSNIIHRLMKTAGQKEINDLNQALALITSTSQAMLKQKDQIDLEFLSDLVEVLSKLQAVTDELTEQGYGRLQSPQEGESPEAPSTQPTPTTGQPASTPPSPAPASPRVQSGPAGVGKVTGPTAKRRIDMMKIANGMFKKVRS